MKIKIRLQYIHEYIIGIAIFLLPFVNSVGWFNSSGGSPSIYVLGGGFLLWILASILLNKKIYYPQEKSAYAFMLFVVMTFAFSFINIPSILTNFNCTTGQDGSYRFITKTVALFFYFFISVYVYNIMLNFRGDIFHFFTKFLIASFLLSAMYSIIELQGIILGNADARELLAFIDELFRGEANGNIYYKIRSLTFESSTLGAYIAIAFPIIFMKYNQRNRKYGCLLLVMMFMVALSISRTLYVVVALQFVLLCIFLNVGVIRYWKAIIIIPIILFAGWEYFTADTWLNNYNFSAVIVSLFEPTNAGQISSNAMRFGSQYAAFMIFLDNPIFGVGVGQAYFYLLDYAPGWIWMANDMSQFMYNMPVFGVYPRVMAESGIVGIITFLAVYIFAIIEMYKNGWRNIGGDSPKEYRVMIIVTIGIFMSNFNWDMMSYPSMWILLGIFWAMRKQDKECNFYEYNRHYGKL